MNEKLQYASMLEIPVNSCNVTFKPLKKKRTKKKSSQTPEAVKQELLDKVNSATDGEEMKDNAELIVNEDIQSESALPVPQETSSSITLVNKTKKPFKITTIGVQLAIVVALIAVIAVTNVLNTNSGINVFMRNLFSSGEVLVSDEREFDSFTPVISFNSEEMNISDGVITVTGEGSVYAPCNGKVSSVKTLEDGSYRVEIAHSENFSTVIEGLTFVYSLEGEEVYSNIPVGYMGEVDARLCFIGADGAIITGYEIIDGAVVWAV